MQTFWPTQYLHLIAKENETFRPSVAAAIFQVLINHLYRKFYRTAQVVEGITLYN